jgi:uncharacterized protein YeaO (DUF488 family)
MPIRIVRLGTPRAPGEGLRLGTVRRPPRGVPKEEFAARDFYDTWLPNVAPSCEGSIGSCGCSPGEVLRDWESPNPQ